MKVVGYDLAVVEGYLRWEGILRENSRFPCIIAALERAFAVGDKDHCHGMEPGIAAWL